jgi:SulP family sulfate permease
VGGGAAYALTHAVVGFDVATLATRFGTPEHPAGIPRALPVPRLPWTGMGGAGLSFGLVRALLPSAIAIAALAAIESLLSAVVADGVTGTQHDPDNELLALGIGNLVVPFFGGLPATGALARTATNIRSGARSPLSAVFHAAFVMAAFLLLAPLLGHLPLACLAALLLMVAWNMSEARHVVRVLREAPRSDAMVLVTCLGLTVAFDMTVAISVGMVLAAVQFMRRMVEITSVRLIADSHPEEHLHLPPGVQVYEIVGPLFFGAAHKATSALRRMSPDLRALIIDLEQVPAIDATGIFNLRSCVDRLRSRKVRVLLAGARGQTRAAMVRAGLGTGDGLSIHATVREAIESASTPLESDDQRSKEVVRDPVA